MALRPRSLVTHDMMQKDRHCTYYMQVLPHRPVATFVSVRADLHTREQIAAVHLGRHPELLRLSLAQSGGQFGVPAEPWSFMHYGVLAEYIANVCETILPLRTTKVSVPRGISRPALQVM